MAVASAPAAFPLTYTDATGQKATLREQPRRIVSLFPSNNDTVFAIGAGDQVIAVDAFTTSPKEAAQKPKVEGDVTTFNIEQIVGLRPDLVLSASGAEEVVDRPLRDAGVTVINTGIPATLADVERHIRDLGRVTGHQAGAGRVAGELRGAVEDVRRRAQGAPKRRVYLETDISTPGKPYTVGKGSLGDEIISLAGGRNIFGGAQSPFPQVSYESIVRADPQVILLGDAEGYVAPGFLNPTTPEEVRARKGFDTTEAVRKNRVVPIYSDRLSPGPRLAQGVRDLAVAIHPEIFGER
jgi:iron complex transport system substrate-binding protein